MVYLADSAAMLTRREASTPRLRLGVLASLLINIALKLHSEESKYTSATPRCTCFPPHATSAQVRLVQVQVHLGYASVYLNLDSAYLRGVGGGHLVQLQLKYASSKFKYTSATPRCTWTWTQRTWAESAKYTTPRCSTYTKVSSSALWGSCNGEMALGICHFRDHFKQKCHFHFLIHWVLLESPLWKFEKIAKIPVFQTFNLFFAIWGCFHKMYLL